MFYKVSFLIILFFIFNGCGGVSPKTTKIDTIKTKQRPKWIDGIIQNDTNKYLYGMGIGRDRQQAIKIALSDMVAKLGTTIESTYESNEILINNEYSNSTITNKIKSKIDMIKINNYKVIKSYKINYREFAVLIQTDKQKLLQGLKDSLNEQKTEIKQKDEALRGSDILTRYNTKYRLFKKAKNLLPQILIISQLDPNFNKNKNLQYISKKEKEFLTEQKKLKFYVNGTKKSIKFINIIKNYLAQHQYKVTNHKHNAVNILLSIKDYIKNNISVLTLNIKVLDRKNHIGGKSIVIKERYNGSKESVYKNAAIHFEQDINSIGINKLIGIELKKD